MILFYQSNRLFNNIEEWYYLFFNLRNFLVGSTFQFKTNKVKEKGILFIFIRLLHIIDHRVRLELLLWYLFFLVKIDIIIYLFSYFSSFFFVSFHGQN